jgi:MarR family 2-MHQ and catechol resistance regulon transcriptional repressor
MQVNVERSREDAATAIAASVPARQVRAFDEAVTALVRLYQFRDREETVAFGLSVAQALSLSATTRALDAMAGRRLVRRTRDPADRRVRRAELTATGRRMWRRLHAELLAVDRAVLEGLAAPEREAVTRAVARLAEATARWRETRRAVAV